MYNNEKFYLVTEANVLASGNVGTQVYVYMTRGEAESKLYKLWGYAANPPAEETKQYFSATMAEYDHGRAVLLEGKVFDYRAPQPAPEPEPNEE